ncbi:DNA-(apurinic or apyrimidinic site) lyase 2 [Phtheirospermum japonicum]|uniref:DNA-(apurinic or apyrimidinic site) endonuclease 2 n=1 Tax=Phtheirospermum japonicum TaxID=374723 RepID=A0A830D8W9_9LAMI|nr:DNA-(apurinic or apyrimidinic site) lyase 2 [Phtheirospermum japonicum]
MLGTLGHLTPFITGVNESLGVATFCRVKSAFSSDEVALPISAEEGFTGVLKISPGLRKNECPLIFEGLEDFSTDELQKIDGEGRCIISDHEHFVLFNVYGPRAESDDTERIQYKRNFFNVLQKRWESLLGQGRNVIVVGDLNISPYAIDRCDAGPDFEKNEFRTWFRSLLVRNGGPFSDVFREKNPDRGEAYTCWPTNSGAEEFNFGSRIDHILSAGPCLHKEENQGHSFVICHIKECDILKQFKRWKSDNTPRHKDIKARNVKLEGSDHVPVYTSLMKIPKIQQHNTPSLSTRYCPQVYGCQQTLVSMFPRRQPAEEISSSGVSSSIPDDSAVVQRRSHLIKGPQYACKSSLDLNHEGGTLDVSFEGSCKESSSDSPCSEISLTKSYSHVICKKKARQSRGSQLSLKSFFQKTVGVSGDSDSICSDRELTQADISIPSCTSNDTLTEGGEHDAAKEWHSRQNTSMQETNMSQHSEKEKHNVALVEWQRIQKLMQTSIPLCKGHKEPCVSRVVKKSGPNLRRRFYVCARAEIAPTW